MGREVTVLDLLLLAVTGVAAGIVSTVASLASLVSFPVLLALGLPPLTANVTNTVALSFTAVITGCHASADVDPHGATSVSLPR